MSHSLDVAIVGTDPDAFEAFYREHVEAVQRFVARRVSDPHVAADLTADVFVAVIETAAGYRAESGSPRAWLFGVARNVVSMELRRRRRHAHAVDRLQGRRQLQTDAMARAVERIDAARDARTVLGRLHALSPALLAVFELTVIDGLDIADTAQALGIEVSTARVRLHRARKQLRATQNDPQSRAVAREAST